MTGPELFAKAHGVTCEGDEQCFYCGGVCDESYTMKQWVKPTFNDRASVAFPSSGYVCAGCTIAMDEKRVMPGKDKPQKTRNYSWVATENTATPYSKANTAELCRVCLSPPEPPYMIAIATTGQKQILWRAPVNHARDRVTVQFEDEQITYMPHELDERRHTAMRLCAAVGKPRLSSDEPWNTGAAIAVFDRYGDDGLKLIDAWRAVAPEPLTRLAVFLTPGKDECQNDHPPTEATGPDRRSGVSPEAGGTDGGGLFAAD